MNNNFIKLIIELCDIVENLLPDFIDLNENESENEINSTDWEFIYEEEDDDMVYYEEEEEG